MEYDSNSERSVVAIQEALDEIYTLLSDLEMKAKSGDLLGDRHGVEVKHPWLEETYSPLEGDSETPIADDTIYLDF